MMRLVTGDGPDLMIENGMGESFLKLWDFVHEVVSAAAIRVAMTRAAR